jgi:hypothetical protein
VNTTAAFDRAARGVAHGVSGNTVRFISGIVYPFRFWMPEMLWLLLAFPCGAAFFQHYLGYYRYPEMRRINLFKDYPQC